MSSRVKVFVFIFMMVLLYGFRGYAQEEIYLPDPEKKISMDFQNANLKDILKIFSIQSNLNFIASEAVAERKITLFLDQVPLKEVMQKLFVANNLKYELAPDSDIIIVKDYGKPETETVTKVFFLKYASVSSSPLFGQMSKGTDSFITSSSSGGSSSTSSNIRDSVPLAEDRGITRAIKKIMSEKGKIIEDYRTNSIIVSDVPLKMPVIEQVIKALDIPTCQILIEVEMLDVSKNAVDEIGVNWPQTLVSLTVPGSKIIKFGGEGGEGRTLDPEPGAFGGPGTTGWDFGAWDATRFGPSILTFIGGTLTLDFLKTQTDTKTLARPRILTLNNEMAEIKITTQEAIGTSDATTSSQQSATNTQAAERFETGVSLRVTPQVNEESGEITMFIEPRVAATTTSSITIGAANLVSKDPEERMTRSILRIKDGSTVVIGGLLRTEKTEVVKKLPILGDMPIIGAAFRHKSKTPDRERELIVFITPHILKDPGQAVKFAAAPNNVRVPAREQNTFSGVDRMATINTALTAFDKIKQ